MTHTETSPPGKDPGMTTPATTDLGEAASHARRATRLFLAATVSFVGLVLTMAIGLSDRQSAQDVVARELDVPLNDIPPDRLADVIRETWSTPAVVLIGALAVVSMVVFSQGVLSLGRVARHQRPVLTRVAAVLPYLGAASFIVLLLVERALRAEPAWLLDHWWVWTALLTIFVLMVTVSVVLVVVRIWPTGLARRSSIVVLVLAVVLAGLSLTASAPPVLPLVLATVFAFNVRKAADRAPGP